MAQKTQKNRVLSAIRAAGRDEAKAVAFIERVRRGTEPACPRCGDDNVPDEGPRDRRARAELPMALPWLRSDVLRPHRDRP